MAFLLMVLIINGRKEDLQEKKYKLLFRKQRLFLQSERKQNRENDEQQQTEYLSVSPVTNKNYTESVRK